MVGHLLAVQAQDSRGARLAIRARAVGVSAADVDRALSVERSLVIGWLNRGTLHLVRREDYWWLHAVTTPQLTAGTMRRLRQEGVDADSAERGVATMVRTLDRDGPLSRSELRERLAGAGVPTAGQALVHLLALASVRGLVVRGPLQDAGTEQAFVLAQDWLGAASPIDRASALARLARRYLTGHGPATDRDLARWAGIPVGEARRGLGAIAAGLAERCDGTVELRGATAGDRPGTPPARLLGAFDPLLLGWRSRGEVVGDREADVVSGGIFRACVLVDGRAAGLWRLARGRVAMSPFARLPDDVAAALVRDGRDVVTFLGDAPQVTGPSPRTTSGARLVHEDNPTRGPSGPGLT